MKLIWLKKKGLGEKGEDGLNKIFQWSHFEIIILEYMPTKFHWEITK